MEIKLNRYSDESDYAELYAQEVGFVFFIEPDDYEIVITKINTYWHSVPKLESFEVYPINPGTDLYTMYGYGHSIISEKKISE